jgi:HEPN domain-containing protein
MTRPRSHLREAGKQLQRAIAANEANRPVWAWFAAHSAAEHALKALRLEHGLNGNERILGRLLGDLPDGMEVPDELLEQAAVLDSHYLPVELQDHPRDVVRPNGAPPSDFAIHFAARILDLVHARLDEQ